MTIIRGATTAERDSGEEIEYTIFIECGEKKNC